ncbi:rCG23199, partial [Rattus norvegicus]
MNRHEQGLRTPVLALCPSIDITTAQLGFQELPANIDITPSYVRKSRRIGEQSLSKLIVETCRSELS